MGKSCPLILFFNFLQVNLLKVLLILNFYKEYDFFIYFKLMQKSHFLMQIMIDLFFLIIIIFFLSHLLMKPFMIRLNQLN